MTDYEKASWGSSVRAWMIFEDSDGHRQGFEIPQAEVEFQYDCDLVDDFPEALGGFVTMRPVNRRWQWHITTFHGFTFYEPQPAEKEDHPQRRIGPATPMIGKATREINPSDHIRRSS